MTNKLSTRFTRAKEIYQKEGLVTLLKRIYASVMSYENNRFYIYEEILKHGDEADFTPRINNFMHRTIETTQQLDELLNEGFDLSLLDIKQVRYRLEKGAILALIFVGCEIGWQGWVAMTEEAKDTFNHWPYKVDFANNEACRGGAWTNPKYRRQGLLLYGRYIRQEYLLSKGIRKTRGIIMTTNTAAVNSQSKSVDRRIYATARYIRIFGLQFWKETPIKSIENND